MPRQIRGIGHQALDRSAERLTRDVEPLVEARDVSFTWYVGLDADATQLGDALWKGNELTDADRRRVVGLYRLTFADPLEVIDTLRDEPVYVMTAMTTDKLLRLKPQNLATGLPIQRLEAVS